jgi:N-acetyl-anhydromuramyl-L-alanine amidase AmpD
VPPGPAPGHVCDGCGTGEVDLSVKPTVSRWEPTSHQSSRNGVDIDHIVVHYTTSRNIEGSIAHFKHGRPRTSAHYIIGRDGELVQMVNDSDRAWHAGNVGMNARSIGIEHVAGPGDRIAPKQAATAAALIGWLMQEYEIPKENVIPHVCVKPTSCCGDLFADEGGGLGQPCAVQAAALHRWMEANGL